MNRVKKEFKKCGFLLENDYPQMPYYLKGKSCFEPGFVLIESIGVQSNVYTRCLNIGIEKYRLNRDGNVSVMFDEYDLGI